MRHSTLATFLLSCCSLFASAAAADTLRMAYSTAPVSIDPYPYSDAHTAALAEHVFETLVALDDSPLLATGWTWENPTSLVVKLRQDVLFQDGTPLVARDVVYSACRMMHRVDGKPNVLTSALGPVTDVVAVDPHTVRFETVAPYPILIQKFKFLKILSANGAEIPSDDIKFDAEGDCGIANYPTQADFDNGSAAIGTGPYKLERFLATGDADLVRNTAYWGTSPEWDRVEIRSVPNGGARIAGLLAGDYELIESPSSEDLATLDRDEGYTYTSAPGLQTIFIVLDTSEDGAPGVSASDGSNPLANVRVREALSLAVDRTAIVERLFKGNATTANQFAPRYLPGAPELPDLEYDPERAKALLSEAGYPEGFSIKLSVPNDRYANGVVVAQAITQYWSRLGLDVTLSTEPWSVFLTRRSGRELGAFMYGWGHPQGAAQLISGAFAQRDDDLGLGAANFSNYDNATFEEAIKAWAVEVDEAQSTEMVAKAMAQAVSDLPGIPLYYPHLIWAHDADLEVTGGADGHTLATMVSAR